MTNPNPNPAPEVPTPQAQAQAEAQAEEAGVLSEQEIAEIEARVEAATPGPWEFDPDVGGVAHYLLARSTVTGRDTFTLIDSDDDGYLFKRDEDGIFVAQSRQDVPALIRTLRHTQERLAQARAALEAAEGREAALHEGLSRIADPLHWTGIDEDYGQVYCRFCAKGVPANVTYPEKLIQHEADCLIPIAAQALAQTATSTSGAVEGEGELSEEVSAVIITARNVDLFLPEDSDKGPGDTEDTTVSGATMWALRYALQRLDTQQAIGEGAEGQEG